MSSAQWSLSIIQGIPNRPEAVPSCVNQMIAVLDVDSQNNSPYNQYYYDTYSYYDGYGAYNDCNLNPVYPTYDLTVSYNSLKSTYDQVVSYRNEISTLESTKSNAQYKQNNAQLDYNTALTEKIAQENTGIYNTQTIQNDIENTRTQIDTSDIRINELKISIASLQSAHI